MRAALALFVCLATLVAGCGESESKTDQLGWKTQHVADGGFALDVPVAWRTIDKLDRKSMDRFAADNPDLAGFRKIFSSGLVKLLAADPDTAEGFATNVNVIVHNLPSSIGWSKYVRETRASVRGLSSQPLHSSQVHLAAGRALRLSYEYQANLKGALKWMAVLQYAFLRRQSEYVVTFTTLSGQRARYRTTFERSARSFGFD